MAQSNYRPGGDDFIEVTPSPGVAVPPASPPVTFSAPTITVDWVCPAPLSCNEMADNGICANQIMIWANCAVNGNISSPNAVSAIAVM